MTNLIAISPTNRHWVNALRADPPELYHLHYNAHWYGQSCLHDDIWSFLIQNNAGDYCGFLAYGQCYEDEYLQENALPGVSELYHLLIAPTHQRQGIGATATELVSQDLAGKGYRSLRVAHNVAATKASRFYLAIGFTIIGTNYDGDPYLEKELARNPVS